MKQQDINLKKAYCQPQIELVKLDNNDLICTSVPGYGDMLGAREGDLCDDEDW